MIFFLQRTEKKSSVLILLDLSAAINRVDHKILLERLNSWVSMKDTAFEWVRSYLSDRTFAVNNHGHASVVCGVPQGSILGPILQFQLTCSH